MTKFLGIQTFDIGEDVVWDTQPAAPVSGTRSGTVLGYNQESARYLVRLSNVTSPRWVKGDTLRSSRTAAWR